MTRIAVILPVFNRPDAVVHALRSVAGQTLLPDQLLVVDDGSTDDTVAAIEQWRVECPAGIEFRLLHQDNAGPGAARNTAARHAMCDWLAFLDSDDAWPPDYLERMRHALEREDGPVAASADVNFDGKLISGDRFTGHATATMVELGPPFPSATVVLASAFACAGGFDSRYRINEDHDLFLRLSLLGSWRYVPGAPVTYRHGQGVSNGHAPPLTGRLETPEERKRNLTLVRRFLHGGGGWAAVPAETRHRAMARLWYQLGRALAVTGQWFEARRALRCALRRNPYHLRAWRRWLVTWWPRT